jgi:hypothetical protein
MEVSAAVERGLRAFAKAGDKLGEIHTPPRCADLLRPGASNCAAGRCGFNRSSLSMSSASMVPVEKIGPGFPQVVAADPS